VNTRPRCGNNISVDRREIVFEAVKWLQLVVIKVLLQVYVKNLKNI